MYIESVSLCGIDIIQMSISKTNNLQLLVICFLSLFMHQKAKAQDSFNVYELIEQNKLQNYSLDETWFILKTQSGKEKWDSAYGLLRDYAIRSKNKDLLTQIYAIYCMRKTEEHIVDSALLLAKNSGNQFLLSKTYDCIGVGLCNVPLYDSAMVFFYKALETAPSAKDSFLIYNRITDVHLNMNAYDYANSGFDKMKRLLEANTFEDGVVWRYYNSRGELYLNTDKLDSADLFYKKALLFANNNPKHLLTTKENIGIVLESKGMFKEAEQIYLEVLELSKKEKLTEVQMFAYQDLGFLYKQTKEYNKGLKYSLEALDLSIQTGFLRYKEMNLRAVSIAYDCLNMHEKALDYYTQYISLRDSLKNIDNVTAIAVMRKEKEFENERQLGKLELEHEKKSNTLKTILLLLSAGLLFLLIYFLYKNKKNSKLIFQKNKELERADEMKSRFFTNVSHELRTPLTLIMGPLQEIVEKDQIDNPKQVKSLLNLSLVNARRINDRINEILNLSKLESNKISVESQNVRVFKFLKRVIFAFDSVTIMRQIIIVFEGNIEEELVLNFDKNKVETILNNLLSNAIKHSPNGAKIKVHAAHQNNELCITVQDEGPGIKAEESEQIFDRFYQSTEGKEKGGTGIGLAFSRELAKVLKGSLVNLPSAKGAKFELKIAAEIAKSAVEEVIAETSDELNFEPEDFTTNGEEKQTVLVVEDNPEMRSYIALILEKYYKVHQAIDGNAALSILKTHKIDIITSDLMMDGMDGFELMEALKGDENHKQIPLIMLTARADEKDKLNALELGVDDYLLKPFKADELLARIKNLLVNIQERSKSADSLETEQDELTAADHAFMQKVQELINKNLSNTVFGVDELCEELAVSSSTLNRKIKRIKGMSGAAFIKEVRLSRAYFLLINRKLDSVKEVSNACGFSRPNYFAKEFHKRFGKKPGEYFNG